MTYVEVLRTMIRNGQMTRLNAERFLVSNGMFADKVQELLDAD
jgi:hypothetical protein